MFYSMLQAALDIEVEENTLEENNSEQTVVPVKEFDQRYLFMES